MFWRVIEMANHIMFAMLLAAMIKNVALIRAQDQTDLSGFISIDCGQPTQNYTDESTGITYISDSTLIDTGESKAVSASHRTYSVSQQLWYMRIFPVGAKNCYTLRPTVGKRYLIRARFMYWNYDLMNQLQEFDLYLGVSFWASIKISDASDVVDKEIIHVVTTENLYLCVVKTSPSTPFISAIELRLIWKDNVYITQSGSLMSYFRYDFGSIGSDIVRYRDDPFDRFWYPMENMPAWQTISTDLPVDSTDINYGYLPPSVVMGTAITPANPTQALNISLAPDDPSSRIYFYFHFTEVQQLQRNTSRNFNITLNGYNWYGIVVPQYLYTETVYSVFADADLQYLFSLIKVDNSNLPPLLNALEAYVVADIVESRTKQDEALAMRNIKSTYRLKMNWQGDPCGPETFIWEGVGCIDDNMDNSSIVSLNLSYRGLTGSISAYLSKLQSLQILNLSNNLLTGPIPEFLAKLPSLKFLDLSSNNLRGSIPDSLQAKIDNKTLQLSLANNPKHCPEHSCKKKFVTPVVAASSSLVALLLIVSAVIWRNQRNRGQTKGTIKSNNRPFTYNEVLKITDNFNTVIGEGGFGKVYQGTLTNGTKVAVKMLSATSKQGFKEFQAEAQLLMIVHHRNLVSLIGYCNDVKNMALIYELMENGDLRQHLSNLSENSHVLTWNERLRIALDTAQGLDYLHNGCRPPIIHRDLKTPNILLNENMQAKIADFGLSKAYVADVVSNTPSRAAGTLGYLDPEFHSSGQFNKKSDVYSFGVILFELITGHPAIIRSSSGNSHILQWVTPILERGDIRIIVDPRLDGNFDVNSAWKLVEIAMACVPPTAVQRPDMSRVLAELKECCTMGTILERSQRISSNRRMTEAFEISLAEVDCDSLPSAR